MCMGTRDGMYAGTDKRTPAHTFVGRTSHARPPSPAHAAYHVLDVSRVVLRVGIEDGCAANLRAKKAGEVLQKPPPPSVNKKKESSFIREGRRSHLMALSSYSAPLEVSGITQRVRHRVERKRWGNLQTEARFFRRQHGETIQHSVDAGVGSGAHGEEPADQGEHASYASMTKTLHLCF